MRLIQGLKLFCCALMTMESADLVSKLNMSRKIIKCQPGVKKKLENGQKQENF